MGGPPPDAEDFPPPPPMPPPAGPLTQAGKAVADALERQSVWGWQGLRVVEVPACGPQPAQRWEIQEGFLPKTGYFFANPVPLAPGSKPNLSPSPVEAKASHFMQTVPWEAAACNPGPLARGVDPQTRLENQLAVFNVSAAPGTVPTLNGTSTGTRYHIKPNYKGGSIDLVIDKGTQLPVEVTRYGFNQQPRYHSTFLMLQTHVSGQQFWFAQAVANPNAAMAPPPMDQGGPGRPPHGGPPRHEPPELLKWIMDRIHPMVLPGGYDRGPVRRVQNVPFFAVTMAFSDGLNPVTLFVARLPHDMPMDQVTARVKQRLDGPGSPVGGNHAMRQVDNWLVIAAGELDRSVLDQVLDKAAHRLQMIVSGHGGGGPISRLRHRLWNRLNQPDGQGPPPQQQPPKYAP